MKEELISFETAKLAKEKEFNVLCFYCYDKLGRLIEPHIENGSSTDVEFRVDLVDLLDNYNTEWNTNYSAPTQSLLQKWLREEYKLSLEVFSLSYHNKIQFTFNVKKLNGCEITILSKNNLHYDSHEEALEAGLVESLKLI